MEVDGAFSSLYWGQSTDIPLTASYLGGRAQVTQYRPSTGHWFILR